MVGIRGCKIVGLRKQRKNKERIERRKKELKISRESFGRIKDFVLITVLLVVILHFGLKWYKTTVESSPKNYFSVVLVDE